MQYKIHFSRNEYRKEYLTSQEWREKANFILRRDPTCKLCSEHKSNDAHHLTYERVCFENLDTDLIGVCRKCHNIIHRHRKLSSCKTFPELKRKFVELKLKGPLPDFQILSKSAQYKIDELLSVPLSQQNEIRKLKEKIQTIYQEDEKYRVAYLQAGELISWICSRFQNGPKSLFASKLFIAELGLTQLSRKEIAEKYQSPLLMKTGLK